MTNIRKRAMKQACLSKMKGQVDMSEVLPQEQMPL
jgi:hypothetical protein